MNKQLFMVIDTETATLFDSVYDIGWTIADKKGNITKKVNYLVKEIFTNGERMTKAHFAKKVFTHYAEMLENGDITLKPWKDIMIELKNDFSIVDCLCAYNAGFDFRVINGTNKQITKSNFPVIPERMKKLDIWHFACITKLKQKLYHSFAKEMGFISQAGNVGTTAEQAYKFITGKWDFVEDHTALSDAIIETEILARCFAMKKAIPYRFDKLTGSPWKLAQAN